MTQTIHQQIIDKIKIRLAAVRTANGYKTEAGKNVFAWRDEGLPKEQLPAICIRDTDEDKSPGAGGTYENTAKIEVEALSYAEDYDTLYDALDNLYGDILKAIGVDDMWDGLADTTEVQAFSKRIVQKDVYFGAISMLLTVEYEHNRWDAYTKT